MASPLYTGSRLFLPLSEIVGIPLDQLNYVIYQSVAIVLGLYLRLFLPPDKVPGRWRSLFCLISGFAGVFFMIGWSAWQVMLQVVVCYFIMRLFTDQRHMGLAVFIYAMGHMLVAYAINLNKPFDQMCYDPTYTLMITTQKLTSLAFSLVDWRLVQKGHKVQEERKKWALKSMPDVLDFLAFILSFQGALAGPFCHYNVFMVFIHGKDHREEKDSIHRLEYIDHSPSFAKAVLTKLLAVIVWMLIAVLVRPLFPDTRNVDPEFIASHGMLYRIGYLYLSLFMDRTKYYVTWILSDAVYNASGMGYTGVDENGRHTWTGMSNVRVWKIETATSLKVYLDNWNIGTTHWLRHVSYLRSPVMSMYLTFVLSSLWHGLYSGYHVTFLTAAFCVAVGRKIRGTIRPVFQTSRKLHVLYEVITFFGTQITLAFLVLSFVILDWHSIVRFHSSFFWILHIGTISLFFLIPSKRSARDNTKASNASSTTANQDGEKRQNNNKANSNVSTNGTSESSMVHRPSKTVDGSLQSS